MKFQFNDGGRKDAGRKGLTGDCVTRSIAIASGLPYEQIYTDLAAGNACQRQSKRSSKSSGKRTASNGINTKRKWFKDYMLSLGFIWKPTMAIGSGCTIHLTDGELPNGRLVVAVSTHYTCVINGIINDTFDPQREIHSIKRFPGWKTIELKPNQTRNVNNIGSIQHRCVYGYYKLNGQDGRAER